MAKQTSLNILCALQAEARPFIDFFKLTKQENVGTIDLFVGSTETGPVHLLVSGIGPLNMAAAVGWLANKSGQAKSTTMYSAWLNVGTAGHKKLPTGTTVRVAHSSGDLSPRDIYLPLVASWGGDVAALHSVSELAAGYPEVALVDMEGSAFFNTASKFSPAELIQAIKVVSDNEEFGVELLNGARLTELMAENIDAIAAFANKLQLLALEVPSVPEFLQSLNELSSHLVQTNSRQRQLRDLVYKSLNIGVSEQQLKSDISASTNIATLLKSLSSRLSSQAPKLGGAE